MTEVDEQEQGAAGPAKPTPIEWGLFFLRSTWRHKVVAALLFVTAFAGIVAYQRALTPVYRVETKILAHRQQALPSVARSAMAEDPTRSAWELVNRRENLMALIEHARLLPIPPREMPVVGTRDRITRWVDAPTGDAESGDPVVVLVSRLAKALGVKTEDGTISIWVEWPDPRQAYDIVDGALQNFLESRHLQEVTAIDEIISVLQGRVAVAREKLEKALADSQRDAAEERAGVSRGVRAQRPSGEAARLRSLLEAKQRAIQDVEDFRRRRLLDMQAQLDGLRGSYSDAHPEVIKLRQDVDALSKESPQVIALREEERKLRAQYVEVSDRDGVSAAALSGRPSRTRSAAAGADDEDDPRVREARTELQQALERVNSAQLELDAARAAFKYRYHVVWPPQLPEEPVGPRGKKLLAVGFVAALGLAVLASVLLDVLRGKVVEPWQLERVLGVPVIARIGRARK